MDGKLVIAVPTLGPGGMEGGRSPHFGHADSFTIVDVADGAITGVRTIANPPHEEGGCLRPVGLLAAEGVTALVAAGMGARPLAGFAEAGITVYAEDLSASVSDVVSRVVAGESLRMDPTRACNHHH